MDAIFNKLVSTPDKHHVPFRQRDPHGAFMQQVQVRLNALPAPPWLLPAPPSSLTPAPSALIPPRRAREKKRFNLSRQRTSFKIAFVLTCNERTLTSFHGFLLAGYYDGIHRQRRVDSHSHHHPTDVLSVPGYREYKQEGDRRRRLPL